MSTHLVVSTAGSGSDPDAVTRSQDASPGRAPVDAHRRCLHEGDIAAQTRRTMDNVETMPAAAGMRVSDLDRYDIHATDLQD